MSQSRLNFVCKKILKEFKSDYRTRLERLKGQIYVFDKRVLLSKINLILNDTNLIFTKEQIKDIKRIVIKAHDDSIKANSLPITKEVEDIIKDIKQIKKISERSNRFDFHYVKSYSSAVRAKRKAAKALENEIKEYQGSKKSQKLARSLSGFGDSSVEKYGAQVGHGDFGAAVSNIKALRIQQILEQSKKLLAEEEIVQVEEWENKLTEYFKEFIILAKLKKEMVLDNRGRLRAKFIPIISFQDREGNRVDAAKEGKYLRQLRTTFEKYLVENAANIEGSDTIITAHKKITTTAFLSKVKKDRRVKISTRVEKISKIDTNTVSSAQKISIKTKKSVNTTKSSGIGKVNIPKNKVIEKKPILNLNALKAQINARLSMTVIKNMGTPALENRTGRFARSAIVTDVVQTSQGFPSIGYTYQKYPYQTFEPGFKQGSVDRDPRTLIDRSIREIATQLIVGRFYTRRV